MVETAQYLLQALDTYEDCINPSETMNKLLSYAVEYFDSEEEMMREVGYPDLEKHTLEYELFASNIMTLKNQVDMNLSKEAFNDITQFIVGWVENHIVKSDMAYKPFVRGNYVQEKKD